METIVTNSKPNSEIYRQHRHDVFIHTGHIPNDFMFPQYTYAFTDDPGIPDPVTIRTSRHPSPSKSVGLTFKMC